MADDKLKSAMAYIIDAAKCLIAAMKNHEERIKALEEHGKPTLRLCSFEFVHPPHVIYEKGDYRQCPGRTYHEGYGFSSTVDADTQGRT